MSKREAVQILILSPLYLRMKLRERNRLVHKIMKGEHGL
jgi:hypothetical protein